MVTAVLWSLDAMIRITLLYTTQFEKRKVASNQLDTSNTRLSNSNFDQLQRSLYCLQPFCFVLGS